LKPQILLPCNTLTLQRFNLLAMKSVLHKISG
jgi:hypothetical protein